MKKIIIIIVLISTYACQSVRDLYQESIEVAMAPDSSKIYSNFVSINFKNEDLIWKTIGGDTYLLVVTWKQSVEYYKPYLDSGVYDTGDYPIWITTAPELYQRMKNENAKDVDLRLKQLLGLPPSSVYNYFVEFWVKPEDLFRPCPDKAIDDEKCDLCFPNGTDTTYIDWINNNRVSRYYECALEDKYPWTQLGYTYDWSPKNRSHIGLSEFVIGKDKNIIVEGIYSTKDYLNRSLK